MFVCGWPLDSLKKLELADKHQIAAGLSEVERTDEVLDYILQQCANRNLSLVFYRLSADGARRALASLGVIGSNRSNLNELQRTQDHQEVPDDIGYFRPSAVIQPYWLTICYLALQLPSILMTMKYQNLFRTLELQHPAISKIFGPNRDGLVVLPW